MGQNERKGSKMKEPDRVVFHICGTCAHIACSNSDEPCASCHGNPTNPNWAPGPRPPFSEITARRDLADGSSAIATTTYITPEPEMPGAFGAILSAVEVDPCGLYAVKLVHMTRNMLDSMRPGDSVEVRKLSKQP